ncbi:MAG: glycosyltransferase family 4 protein [Candidatus Sumerlaea chitinivorans]|nr:glycosyltransferase family 4 protein [Candidatus Sumerlaea chitinivorans]
MGRKIQILVDGRTVRPGMTGVGHYTLALTREAARLAEEWEFHVLTLYPELWGKASAPNLQLHHSRVDYEAHPAGDLWEHLILPHLARRLCVNLVWGPAYLIPWGRQPFARVVTIHDLTVFTLPREYPPLFAAYLRWVIQKSYRWADVVVTDSSFVATTIRSLMHPAQKVIEVVPNGVAPEFFDPDAGEEMDWGLPERYILSVGAGNPRKNLSFGAAVVECLRNQHGMPYSYVVVGDCELSSQNVIAVPPQPIEKLAKFYRRAELFLFPSVDEGFGVPVLEAMASGCPVAAAKRGAIPEVAGSAAFLFELEEGPERVAARLADLLRDQARLNELREAGRRRAAEYTWGSAAEKLLKVFERVIRTKHHER